LVDVDCRAASDEQRTASDDEIASPKGHMHSPL